MPAFLEKKLKKEYGKNSSAPFAIMNSLGYMQGNKETAKGAAAQEKHDKKVSAWGRSLHKFRLRRNKYRKHHTTRRHK